MADVVYSGRFKMVGALLGGVLLTSAAAWLPMLGKELEKYHLSHVMGINLAYALFFIIAFFVSYIFVTELIKARIQIKRCDDVLNTSVAFELHDKQLFNTMGKKQILMAKRNEWPVSMFAIHIKAMKGPKPAPGKRPRRKFREKRIPPAAAELFAQPGEGDRTAYSGAPFEQKNHDRRRDVRSRVQMRYRLVRAERGRYEAVDGESLQGA